MPWPLSNIALTGVLLASLAGCRPASPPPPPLPALPEVTAAGEEPRGEERPRRELTLVLTGDVRGEIEPCGCPTLPFGGFERRERLLSRPVGFGPVFQLDAGELLTRGISASDTDREGRARTVLAASASVGVAAWVPGPSDLFGLGLDEMAAVTDPPAVSATWLRPDGTPLFPPALVLERDGRRIGVIGLSASPMGSGMSDRVQVRDAVEAAREALSELPTDLDLVLALGSVSDDEADRVAREVPGLSLILTTSGRNYNEVREVSGVPIIESLDRGRYAQVLATHLGSTPDVALELHPAAATWRNLVQLRATNSGSPNPALDGAEAAFRDLSAGRNLAWLETRPLAQDLDGPTRVAALLGDYKTRVLTEAAARAAEPPPPTEPGFATAASCTTCHTNEFARWTFSDHTRAWQSLVERQATANPECLPCHTTGFGQPGGMGELTTASIRAFKGVQCESCHGPMRGHPDDPRVQSGPVTVERCLTCHDEANSPDFDWPTYLARATCQDVAAP